MVELVNLDVAIYIKLKVEFFSVEVLVDRCKAVPGVPKIICLSSRKIGKLGKWFLFIHFLYITS